MSDVRRVVARVEMSSRAVGEALRETLASFGNIVTGIFVGREVNGLREVYVELECGEVALGIVVEKLKGMEGVRSLKVRDVGALVDFTSPWRKAF
ncbi:MAG: hypothetical protein NZ957_00360 [Thaumarchaeota archaeon]|nr:hypothetical protein [Candidatus Calditenuaceae archaeon]MDW8041230.1 hypothetical protein [Nitrososphaerota archaeon]